MYSPQPEPVREEDFSHEIIDKYFGVGWTKVYIEKLCEFYSRIGPAKMRPFCAPATYWERPTTWRRNNVIPYRPKS